MSRFARPPQTTMRALGRRPASRLIAGTRARLCSANAGVDSRKEVSALLCAGGDSRLHLTARGTNKYFCAPEPNGCAVLRSSCTCSPPSDVGFSHALDKWHELEAARGGGAASFEQAFGGAMDR